MLFVSTDPNITTEIGSQQPVRKVVFIIVDGIPADVIENVQVPNIRYIREVGAYTRAHVGGDKGTYTETATISAPGYMSLLTGTWGHKHNVFNNYVKDPNYHYKNIFRLFKEQQPEKRIGIFSTWTTNRLKLIGEGLSVAGNITFDYKFDGYELDRTNYPHDKRSRYIHNIDERVTNETRECIKTHAPDLSWVYLQYTDDIGHYFGDSEPFYQAIMLLDDQIGRIWEAIDYRINFYEEDWLVIITTDHGRDGKTGKNHDGQSVRERTTWIVTNSEETNTYFHDFQPGVIDILPTIARFMNMTIPVDSERDLDGILLIGEVSLIKPVVSLNGDQLNISWTVLYDVGNVTIWLSTSNLFRKGMPDDYQLIDIVPIGRKTVVIDVKKYPSEFYKIVLEGKYNTVNRWIHRQWRRNRT